MKDINVLRDFNFLIRARCRSNETRDVNAHQCSQLGKEYLTQLLEQDKTSSQVFRALNRQLSCNDAKIKTIILGDNMPYFQCDNKREPIQGFLNPVSENDKEIEQLADIKYKPFFL